ncbi:ABC transporter permease [Flavihumibacter profundi]|uniref:ABC transporter permease n=1 Tax=Flavihumibacter profundi TaxID=2716883 RepID=UPI001CC7213F|nr:ABC transporter permease [Flavihumibacter profundi]MBZ5855823.1 ABC transporter permease [Flavihumibacter profundi]
MQRSFWVPALRNFWKHKFLSAINIGGLAIGISASLVIYLMVSYEFSFDTFHKNKENIYRVVSQIDFPDLRIYNSGVPVPTAAAARQEIPGLKAVTHYIIANETKVSLVQPQSANPKDFRNQKNIIYTDPYYFDIIGYTWLKGTASQSLQQPFQVVLTKSRCTQYFPGLDYNQVLGHTITYNDSIKTTVTGIVEDLPGNTDFQFKEFISRSTIEQTGLKQFWNWDQWGSINDNSQMLVVLATGINPGRVEKQLANLRNKFRQKDHGEASGKDDTRHFLQPLADIHFNTDYGAFQERQANKSTLYGLLAVAFFLLLLGCINFINLSTAQATTRSKEVGIRKTLGASKKQLMMQFMGETFLFTVLATILSILIMPWIIAVFGNFIPPAITQGAINQWHVWLFIIVLILVVTVFSGYYPGIILSRLQPVSILKNQVVSGKANNQKAWIRKTLTVSQFMIAQFLLLATLVVSKQIHYSLNKDLGYKRDAIIFFNTPWNWSPEKQDQKKFVLLQKLQSIPEIEKTSLGGAPPASSGTNTTTMVFNEGKKKLETMVEVKYADTNYFSLYGMKLLAGRNLQQSDTTKEFVINETYAKMMGFTRPEQALGHFIDRNFKIPITGVLADFHTKSTHEAIKPLAYSSAAKNSYVFHVALKNGINNADHWKKGIAKIEQTFKELYPDKDFEYTFFDESIAAFYKTEEKISGLLKWASGLCLLISSLGLLGLVIFTTNARTKEIGVRKVLGASITQIVFLLSKDFISLVLLAFIIVTPIAGLVMKNWLQNFAYRTEMNCWIFAASGAIMMLIAIITLSIRTIHSAAENPIHSLRSE